MMDELRDYRYYATDMIHPSEMAVDYIYERFAETYFTDEAIRTAEEVVKIKKSLSHRPLHPNSEEYEKFKKKLSLQIDAITKKYPNIKL
jgi:CRISPR/Cas system-associated protein Csx1